MATELRLERAEHYGVVWFRHTKKTKSIYDPTLWDILGRTKRLRKRQKRYLKRIRGRG